MATKEFTKWFVIAATQGDGKGGNVVREDFTLHTKPLAQGSALLAYAAERECLKYLGSVFHVEDVFPYVTEVEVDSHPHLIVEGQ